MNKTPIYGIAKVPITESKINEDSIVPDFERIYGAKNDENQIINGVVKSSQAILDENNVEHKFSDIMAYIKLVEAKAEASTSSVDTLSSLLEEYRSFRNTLIQRYINIGGLAGTVDDYADMTTEEIINELIKKESEAELFFNYTQNPDIVLSNGALDIPAAKINNSEIRLLNEKDGEDKYLSLSTGTTKNGIYNTNTAMAVEASVLGGATSDKVLSGIEFSSESGIKQTGTMRNVSGNPNNITFTNENDTPVIQGDACFYQINSDGTERFCIRTGNGNDGYYNANTLLAIPTSNSTLQELADKLGNTLTSSKRVVQDFAVPDTNLGISDRGPKNYNIGGTAKPYKSVMIIQYGQSGTYGTTDTFQIASYNSASGLYSDTVPSYTSNVLVNASSRTKVILYNFAGTQNFIPAVKYEGHDKDGTMTTFRGRISIIGWY